MIENQTDQNDIEENQEEQKKQSVVQKYKMPLIVLGIILILAVVIAVLLNNPSSSKWIIGSDDYINTTQGIIAKAYEGVQQTATMGVTTSSASHWNFKRIDGLQKSNYTWTINDTTMCIYPVGSKKASIAYTELTGLTKANGSIKSNISSSDYVIRTSGNGANTMLVSACLRLNSTAFNYVKIGSASTEASNDPSQTITIDETGANLTCGIEKYVNGAWNPIEALWANGNEWGLNDPYNLGTNEQYRITCDSTLPYVNLGDNKYQYGIAEHDFSKTCLTSNGCVFTDTNETSMQVVLNSTGYIDPTYTIPIITSSINPYTINTTYEPSNCTHLSIDTTSAPYSSLTGYWMFDCDTSSTAYDTTASNYDGTYNNGAYYTTQNALYGSAATFDGTNDYVSWASNLITTTNFTISGWARMQGAGGGGNKENPLFMQRDDTAGTNKSAINFFINSTLNASLFAIRSTGGDTQLVIYPVKPQNEWHYYAGVVNSTTISLYIDGVFVNSTVNTQSGNYITSIDYIQLGRHRYGGVDYGYFNGSIDEVMIFNTALNSTQISDIYNNQSARFLPRGEIYYPQVNVTPNNTIATIDFPDYQANLGTNLSAKIGYWDMSLGYNETDPNLVAYYHADNVTGNGNVVTGKVGKALNFTPTSYVTLNSLGNLNNFTYCGWLYMNPNVAWQAPFGHRGVGITGFQFVTQVTTNFQPELITNSNNAEVSKYCFKTAQNVSAWKHYCWTYDSSAGGKLYINGTNYTVETGASCGGGFAFTGTRINMAYSSGTGINGSQDEVRVWNRSLSATEIANIYSNESAGQTDANMNRTGLVGEWLFNESATSLWASQTPDTSGNGNNGAEINMVGANISDSSGNGNNGVTQGGTNLLSAGKYNQTFTFDAGASSVVNIPNSPSLNITGTQASIGAWVKFSESLVNQENAGLVIAGKENWATSSGYILMFRTDQATNPLVFRIDGTICNGVANWAPNTFFDDLNWHYITGIYDGVNTYVYADGILRASGACGAGNINATTTSAIIGSAGSGSTLNGSIDEVMIWNRSLTASEISDLYSRGRANWQYTSEQNLTEQTTEQFNYSASSGIVSCWLDGVTDSCGGGNNGINYGSSNWTNTNRGTIGNKTLSTNGTATSYFDVPHASNLNLTSSLSIGMWISPNSVSNYNTLLTKSTGTTTINYDLSLGSTGALRFAYNNATNCGVTTPVVVSSTATITPNNWNYVTVTLSGTALTFYINGISAGTGTITNLCGSVTGNLTLGKDRGTNYYNGYIDEVAIWNRALTPSEVQQIYLGTKQGRTAPLNFTIQTTTTNILPIAVLTADPTYRFYTPFIKGIANIGGYITTSFPPDLCAYNGTGNWVLDCAVCNGYAMLATTYNLMRNNWSFSGSGTMTAPGTYITNFTRGDVYNGCKLIFSNGGRAVV